jgi:hypothetical protein
MAFSGSFMCSSFKQDMLAGRMNFLSSGGNSFKMSLYTNSATTMDATRTAYNTPAVSGEVPGTGNYTTTGSVLVINTSPPNPQISGTTAFVHFNDITWTTSTISLARGALIYNDTITTPVADPAVAVLDFGADKTSSAGDFTVQFPANGVGTAIIRIT